MLKPLEEMAELLATAAEEVDAAADVAVDAAADAAADEAAADDGTTGKTREGISGYLILRSMSRSRPRYVDGPRTVRSPPVEADALAAAATVAAAGATVDRLGLYLRNGRVNGTRPATGVEMTFAAEEAAAAEAVTTLSSKMLGTTSG